MGVEGWKGGMRVTDNGYGISFWSDASVVELVVMAALFCEYSKSCWVTHFKRVDFMVCELYLNKAVIKKKLNIYLPYKAGIPFLCIFPRNKNICLDKEDVVHIYNGILLSH